MHKREFELYESSLNRSMLFGEFFRWQRFDNHKSNLEFNIHSYLEIGVSLL